MLLGGRQFGGGFGSISFRPDRESAPLEAEHIERWLRKQIGSRLFLLKEYHESKENWNWLAGFIESSLQFGESRLSAEQKDFLGRARVRSEAVSVLLDDNLPF